MPFIPESILKQKYFHGIPVKRILRELPGNTGIRHVSVFGISFAVEVVLNPDILMNVIEEKSFGIDERLPYWSELWPSSFALAESILQNKSAFKRKTILEIGCGLGLCGLAARKSGARIHFTDNDPIALFFTKRNYRRNFSDRPDVYYLDWRGPYPAHKFDFIIGADVLYEKRFFQPIYILVDSLLSEGGQFVVAEPQRPVAADFFRLFSPDMWKKTVTKKKVDGKNAVCQINIHHIEKC